MKLTVRIIAEMVALHFGLSYRVLVSQRREPDINQARRITYFLARRLTAHTWPQIGAALGDRDHATVLVGARFIEQRLTRSPELAEAVSLLEAALRAVEITVARSRLTPPPDIDPLAVAWRVMASDREAISPSADEILALAIAVIGAEHEAQSRSQQSEPAQEPTHV